MFAILDCPRGMREFFLKLKTAHGSRGKQYIKSTVTCMSILHSPSICPTHVLQQHKVHGEQLFSKSINAASYSVDLFSRLNERLH